ncbi:MAG TPA: AAA family ATPase, partial [Beutenbergiaceae bacterium]|nr:AAA family ATPase [Beutenbergiaceae bacterium]
RFLTTGSPEPHAIKGYAFISVLTVGSPQRVFTPRPVEITALTSDGQQISTLINPTCDLYDARTEYGIEVADIQFAPILAEAWPAFEAQLNGYVPVGVDIDSQLGYVDAELKRGGTVAAMPIGISIDPGALNDHEHRALNARTAQDRAVAVWQAAHRLQLRAGAETTPFAHAGHGVGYLLPRGEWPHNLAVEAARVQDLSQVEEHLKTAIARAHLDPDAVQRIEQAQNLLNITALTEHDLAHIPSISEVLAPGVRVCFTGTVVIDGRQWPKEELEDITRRVGYEPVANVTKTRCDVLIVAEAGTQSRKARNAIEYGKPMFTAQEFLTYLGELDTP